MSKLILSIAMLFSVNANAGVCESIYDLSGSIVEARENGVSYNRAIEIANENSDNDLSVKDMTVSLVDWAYSINLSGTKADKEVKKNEFKKEAYVICLGYFDE